MSALAEGLQHQSWWHHRGNMQPTAQGAAVKGGYEGAESDGMRSKGAGLYLSKDETQQSGSSRHMHTHAHAYGGVDGVCKQGGHPHGCASLHHSHGKQEGRKGCRFLALVRNSCVLIDIIRSTK